MAQELMKKQSDGNVAVAERTRQSVTYTPRFDIVETDGELRLYGDLPGVCKDSLDIRFENGQLTVQGKVEPRHAEHEFLYGEYGIGDFYRSFTISEDIDAEKISAELNNGVLTLHLPKTEAVKPRKIAVKVGN
jgi:HSP20 family protein